MSQDTSQERTEQATPKRLKDTREKGQIPRSRDLSSMIMLLTGSATLYFFVGHFVEGFDIIINQSLWVNHEAIFQSDLLTTRFETSMKIALWHLLPFLIVLVVAALLGPLFVGGWSFSKKALMPKLERISLLKGLKRIFAIRGLVELVKALLKFAVIATALVLLLWFKQDEILSLGNQSFDNAIKMGMQLVALIFVFLSASLLIIAVVDVPFQLWEHSKKIKMTKQEVKEEYKDTEGKPEVKSHIKTMQRTLANARMMDAVPKADVIITNPIHFAVALVYDKNGEGAPRVVAKGCDVLAMQIQAKAKPHRITILQIPPLARAIYYSTELNHEIPQGLYVAVAQVLAYVYQLKQYRSGKGNKPKNLKNVPIPDDFVYD